MVATTAKLDLQKADPNYYKVSENPDIRRLDDHQYVSTSGKGDPDGDDFKQAIEKIYALCYGIKFLCKAEDNDFVVPKMECFWYIDGGPQVQHMFPEKPRSEWIWNIVIRMPEFVETDHFERAMVNVKNKKGLQLDGVLFQTISGGDYAQILHKGSYDNEGPSLERLHQFIKTQSLEVVGYHREIYISDPRKVPPAKLKTILRYKVK